METILILQIVFIFLMFILNVVCAFIPLKIVPTDPAKLVSRRQQRILSLCSCISGGVFLGTCYLQLIPFLQKKFDLVFRLSGADLDYSDLTTQCTVMAGFFLILFIEQSVQACQERRNGTTRKYAVIDSKLPETGAELIELPDGGYIASSDTSLSDESDCDDAKRHMLKKSTTPTVAVATSKTLPVSNDPNCVNNSVVKDSSLGSCSTFSSSRSSIKKRSVQLNNHQGHGHGHGHSHGGTASSGHGHSHIADLVTADHGLLRSFLLLAALSVHSLFEGMAVGLQETVMSLINLFIGVLLHECLIAFSVGVSLAQQQSRIKRGTIYKLCIVFSLMIPVGMAIGLIIGGLHGFYAELSSALIQGIAAGTFVYVIFFEILPAEINTNQDRMLKVFFIFFGFGIILCLQLSMNEHSS